MILGASHMTLACSDIGDGIASLARLGYQAAFTEIDLPSAPGKTPILSAPRELHSIAFARAAGGFPIELVCYGRTAAGPAGRFIGIFRGQIEPNSASPVDVAVSEAFGLSVTSCELTNLSAAVGAANRAQDVQLVGGALRTTDPIASKKFWCEGVGFRETSRGPGWARLDLAVPVATWRFSLVLVEVDDLSPAPMLDAPGMACLTFLCTSVERDRQSLISGGGQEVMSPFRSVVNGRTLNVEILRGTDGAFVELIEMTPISLPESQRNQLS